MGHKHSRVSGSIYGGFSDSQGDSTKNSSKKVKTRSLEIVGQRLTSMPPQTFEHEGASLDLVNFSCNRLQSVPVLKNESLTGVLLWGNRLKTFEMGKQALLKLRVLDLGHNDLKSMPCLASVPNLIDLNLAYNDIEAIDDDAFTATPNLESIKLEYNALTTLPQSLFLLTGLTVLHLQCNRIRELPQTTPAFTKLVHLLLRENDLVGIHEAFFHKLGLLQTVDLAYNRLTSIPASLWALPAVETIILCNNAINGTYVSVDAMTDLIGCSCLTTLDLSHNPLDQLSDGVLPRFVALYTLRLRGCGLTELPTDIGQMTTVSMIDLADNGIRDLPVNFQSLGLLRELDLSKNLFGLAQADGLTCLWKCLSIQLLDLSSNQLTYIAPQINRLPFLCHLGLADNLLTDDLDIRCIAMATESKLNINRRKLLDLSFNRLTQFPKALRDLRGVEHVFLHGNAFNALPPPYYARHFPLLETLTMSVSHSTEENGTNCTQTPSLDSALNHDAPVSCIAEFKRNAAMKRLYVYGCERPRILERCIGVADSSVATHSSSNSAARAMSFRATAWDDIYLRVEDFVDVTIPGLGVSQLTGTSVTHGLEDRCCACRIAVAPPIRPRTTLQSPSDTESDSDTVTGLAKQMARNKPRGPGPGPRTKLERFIQDNSESGLETNGLLVGVFDGHSGQFASAFARKMFPKELAVIVADGQGESRVAAVEQALRHTFANVSGCMRQYVLAHQTTDPDTAPAPRSPPRNSGPVRNADTRARIERISGQSKGIAGQNGAAAERTEGSVTEDAAHTEQTSRADGSFRIGSKEHIAGCAVLVVVVLQDYIVCANAGDCRAIIINSRDDSAQDIVTRHTRRRRSTITTHPSVPIEPSSSCREISILSTDHRPGTRMERARIKQMGGYILERSRQVLPGSGGSELCRLTMPNMVKFEPITTQQDTKTSVTCKGFYSLGVSRGLGDFHCHPSVSDEPSIHHIKRDPSQQILCLASDGLWDYLANEEVADMILNSLSLGHDCNMIAARLSHCVQALGGADDLSIMVVNLKEAQLE